MKSNEVMKQNQFLLWEIFFAHSTLPEAVVIELNAKVTSFSTSLKHTKARPECLEIEVLNLLLRKISKRL